MSALTSHEIKLLSLLICPMKSQNLDLMRKRWVRFYTVEYV
jgi:uncharacterized protein YbaR (Trm112 family)